MTDTSAEEYKIPPLLTAKTAELLANQITLKENVVEISLDLGLSEEEATIDGKEVKLRNFSITHKQLLKISKRSNIIFALDEQGPYPLEIREDGYAKLVPYEGGNGPPTLELSGIKMHRTKGINPFEDARTKVLSTIKSGDKVLDTCGGLGYTSIWSRRLGAAMVTSCEINPNTRALRRYNPWSREFLNDTSITRLEGDIAQHIMDFKDDSFDAIVHDPPRFSLAGELYGDEFIQHLARVLTFGGKMVFYTGEPYRAGRGRSFIDGVRKRLQKLRLFGEYDRQIQAITATKR